MSDENSVNSPREHARAVCCAHNAAGGGPKGAMSTAISLEKKMFLVSRRTAAMLQRWRRDAGPRTIMHNIRRVALRKAVGIA